MKKLFVSILALAAFAACQSDFNNDVNFDAPQGGSVVSQGEHTIYAEVGVGEQTKATYGDDLKALWEENDQIALLQEHADYGKTFGVVNKLNIKEGWGTSYAAFNGNISVDATSPRVYHIAYPANAVSFSTSSSLALVSDISYQNNSPIAGYQLKASGVYNYTYNSTLTITLPAEQNGKWEPYMYASTSEAVSSNGIGAKTLTTLTGAIAIRAFEPDGVTPKQLKSITITSSDAAIAGTFSGTATSVGSLGTVTGDETAWHTAFEESSAQSKARASLESKAQSMEPTSTSVTKAMSLAFNGNEKSITITNLENIPMDSDGYYTYYINVAPATVGSLEIAALDVNGGELECTLSNQTFAASLRKGYKLTWEEASLVPGTIETWYNNWNTSSFELAGNTIYARNIGVNGVPADHILALGVEIDGQLHAASAQSGVLSQSELKIEGVSNGTYSICTYAKIMLNGHEKELRGDAQTITVTPIPTATYSVYTSYSKNGGKALRNDVYGNEYRARVDISDVYIQTNFVQSTTLTYGGSSIALTLGQEWKTTLGYGSYSSSIKVVLKNGYTLTSPTYATYVTGIPYTLNTSSNDGTWTEDDRVNWNTDGGVRLGYMTGGVASIEKRFYLPADTTIAIENSGSVRGSAGVTTSTYDVYVSGPSVYSTNTKKGSYQSFSTNITATMTAATPTVKMRNSTSTNTCSSVVKVFKMTYKL